jgi:hypothetical protein
LIGTVAYGEAEFYRGPVGRNTTQSEFSLDGVTALPRVDIIMAHQNMDGALIDAAVASGARGLVIAGVGNGNMTKTALDALAAQAKKGASPASAGADEDEGPPADPALLRGVLTRSHGERGLQLAPCRTGGTPVFGSTSEAVEVPSLRRVTAVTQVRQIL